MELLQPLYDTSFLIKAHLYLQIQSQFYKWENLALPFFSHISLHVEVWTLRYLALITLPSLFGLYTEILSFLSCEASLYKLKNESLTDT